MEGRGNGRQTSVRGRQTSVHGIGLDAPGRLMAEPEDRFRQTLRTVLETLQAEHEREVENAVRRAVSVFSPTAIESSISTMGDSPVLWGAPDPPPPGDGNEDVPPTVRADFSTWSLESGASTLEDVIELWPVWHTPPKDLKGKLATSDLLANALQGKNYLSHNENAEDTLRYQLRHVDEVTRAAKCTMIRPDSPRRIAWDMMGIMWLVIDLAWIPMQAFDPPPMTPVTVFEWITLIFWTMDMVASCNTGFMANDGTVNMNRRQVIFRYVKSWFAFDILLISLDWASALPQLLAVSSSSSEMTASTSLARSVRLLRVTRIFRVLRLLRLLKLRQMIMAITSFVDSEWMTIFIAVGRNLITIVAINHTLACCWFAVGRIDESRSWVKSARLEDKDLFDKYMVSLHWSLAQFTPGNTSIEPQNIWERLFANLMLIFGMVIFTCFVSSITSLMQAVWSVNRYRTTQAWLLKKFLRQNKVSNGLFARVTRYTDLVVERQQKTLHPSKVQFLTLLSGPLHIELQMELFSPRLTVHPFFKKYAEVCMSAIRELSVKAVCNQHYAKTDTIYHRSVQAHNMYFIVEGSALYHFHSRKMEGVKRTVKLEKDQWCSEAVLWMQWVHSGEMKALTESNIIALNAAKFREVSTGHYDAFLAAQECAKNFVEQVRVIAASGDADVTDADFRVMEEVWRHDARGVHFDEGRSTIKNDAEREMQEAENIEAELMSFSDDDDDDENDTAPKRKSEGRRASFARRSPTRRALQGSPDLRLEEAPRRRAAESPQAPRAYIKPL
mmetsp:Transcript_92954/g.240123  ORF Transcript_92954/g.240123 Transcript_92954/m.240123 type:complete len:784 (-) Transcript_92954:145-2496(-)